MTKIQSRLSATANSINRFHLMIVAIGSGILMAFAPVATVQTTEKVLYNFVPTNSNGPVSSVIRDAAGNFSFLAAAWEPLGRFSRWIRRAKKPSCTPSCQTR